ncbi:MAG: hypothetical protein HQL39_09655 [Alphaproteobacteria bacterium]|nr:hypothetical protein [Alphaproteobacteria bacterium]
MAVRPEDILEEAGAMIAAAASEPRARIAAGAAYRAAHHHVRLHPRMAEFRPDHSGKDHQGLIEFLKQSSDQRLRRLGHDALPRLRALRIIADYHLGHPFTAGHAKEAVDIASEVIFEFLPH